MQICRMSQKPKSFYSGFKAEKAKEKIIQIFRIKSGRNLNPSVNLLRPETDNSKRGKCLKIKKPG